MTEQRRLAAIVSVDVAGYSRLMGRDESRTLAALKALRRDVVDPAITRHRGRIPTNSSHTTARSLGDRTSNVNALASRALARYGPPTSPWRSGKE